MSILLRRFSYLFMAAMLLLRPELAAAEEKSWNQLFQTNIHSWMENIISHDNQFSKWRKARIEVQALGANQHQWLVSITQSGKQVGYLIVGEAMPGKEGNETPKFVLLEYGVGDFILFDDAFAPKQVAAEPVYDGFASYWRVVQNNSQRLVDAKTGERYPPLTKPEAAVMKTVGTNELATDEKRLTRAHTLLPEATDPFDQIGWMYQGSRNPGQSRSRDALSWKHLLQQQDVNPVILNVSLFKDEVMAPFSVGTIHLWNEQAAYVGVWDQGLRFVPYAYANKVGTFLYSK